MSNRSRAQEPKAAPKKKLRTDWIYSRRSLAIISILLSITMWALVKLNVTQESSSVFQDINIEIQAADLYNNFGLEKVEIIGPDSVLDGKVDVVAHGNLYQLSQVTRDNITVTAAQTGTVSQPGVYRLSLSVSCDQRDVSVEFANGENYVTVRFDRTKTLNLTVDAVTTNGASVATDSGLIVGETFSSIKTLKVSGPETEISAIASVEIVADVNQELTETTDFKGRIVYKDSNGIELGESFTKFISIIGFNDTEGAPTEDQIIVTVPINSLIELPVSISFKKAPSSFDVSTLKYTLTPQTVTLEGKLDAIGALAKLGKYDLEDSIDVSTLSIGNSIQQLKLNLSSGIVETKGVSEISAIFDFSGYAAKPLKLVNGVTPFVMVNNTNNLNVSLLTGQLENVVVMGPAEVINFLTELNCVVEIDLSSIDSAVGQKLAPASISFAGINSCWAVGTYQVKVQVQ